MSDQGQRMQQWARERSRGRGPFIWRRGVIGWGLPAALLTIAYKLYQQRVLAGGYALTPEGRTGILVSAVVFPLCGYLFGRWLWESSEKEYERFLRREGDDGGMRDADAG